MELASEHNQHCSLSRKPTEDGSPDQNKHEKIILVSINYSYNESIRKTILKRGGIDRPSRTSSTFWVPRPSSVRKDLGQTFIVVFLYPNKQRKALKSLQVTFARQELLLSESYDCKKQSWLLNGSSQRTKLRRCFIAALKTRLIVQYRTSWTLHVVDWSFHLLLQDSDPETSSTWTSYGVISLRFSSAKGETLVMQPISSPRGLVREAKPSSQRTPRDVMP